MSSRQQRRFTGGPAVRVAQPLWLAIIGASGSGKTLSGILLAEGIKRVQSGPIVVIDTENFRALKHSNGNPDRFIHIPFEPPFGPLDYIDALRGSGHNGPPGGSCPGRAVCAGKCGQLSVHAEVRALREAAVYIAMRHPPGPYDLVHVELAEGGGVKPCGGPSCWQCSREILDVGFVGGMWLYELPTVAEANSAGVFRADDPRHIKLARWRRYTAAEFHRATLERCGMVGA